MVAMLVRPGAACLGSSIRSMLNLTAAASNGSPLWNFTLRRSLNCHVVSFRSRQDSARLPSSWSVLRLRRSKVSKICRSGSWAFLSQCMCQSSVAASPDCTTTTGRCWAGASEPGRATARRSARVQPIARAETGAEDCRRAVFDRVIARLLSTGGPWRSGCDGSGRTDRGRPGGVAEQVDPHHGHEERRAGEEREPVASVHELPALRQHAAPGGDRQRDAESQEGEAGLGQDGPRHAERRHHDERGADVRQHVAAHDRREGDAEGARGVHERLLPGGQRLGAHDPRVGDPVPEAHDQHDVADAGPQHTDHGDGQEDEREGELHVGEAHDGVVPGAPAHAGQEAEAGADRAGEEHGREADQDRGLGPVDHAAQDVPAELVGAQDRQRPVGRAARRSREARQEVLLVRIRRRQPRRRDGARRDDQEDRRAEAGASRREQDAGPAPRAPRLGARPGRRRWLGGCRRQAA